MKTTSLRQVVTAAIAFAAIAATSLAAQPNPDQATVKVDNRNTNGVVVYAVTDDGARYRLGEVNRLCQSDLVIPATLANGTTQFRLKVYSFEAARSYKQIAKAVAAVKTSPMAATAGETITLMIQADITKSYVPAL
ncbi:MAG: hypothetical protein JSW51_11180 [Gemmatimonadota bacterium]|nr:MAG: hypothetical protein JSW51_11180 [Gemmatimonadota bacterium]